MRITSTAMAGPMTAGGRMNSINHMQEMSKPRTKGSLEARMSLREKLRAASPEQKDIRSGALQQTSLIESAQNNAQKLREQRLSKKSTALKTKSLKYKFKDISTKIMRSKTSASARQVVGQARREVQRLKREKQSGNYDSEEIEAAISHASAMERIARKKVKHLLEEEMAKASGGPCMDAPEAERAQIETDDAGRSAQEAGKSDNTVDESAASGYTSEEYIAEEYDDNLDNVSLDELFSQMKELSTKLLDDVSEDFKDMLEDLMPIEFTDASASKGETDPSDLEAMKIKHRNKEMKDIVKADCRYLKAMFEHYEGLRSGGQGLPSAAVNADGAGTSAVIDISL